ncbi:MAG TPA: peptide ABC transporter substrate-binding protein [Rhizomicrobium sp.]|nr:peptide ABC transporter substrate-binding protein [Rhizomicrobium sp.]
MMTGLATEDAAGNPIPGAAKSWSVSADGKTWTFHLRRHRWSDGVPVTSHDFAFAWRRLLDPKTAAPYAYNMWVVKNAEAISAGKLPPSALGVSTPDDSTFVVQLEHPAAYLPQLLMHQTAFPIPRHTLLKYGNAWSRPQNDVSNGPYMVQEWIPNDHVTLVKNPYFYDAAHVRIATVRYFNTPDAQSALMRFRGHELDTQNPYPAAQIAWMRANLPAAIRSVPYLGIDYIVTNFRRKAFRDIRIREALSLAYDREAIVYKIRKVGETPAYNMIPPGVANYPNVAALDFKAMPYAARVAKAQRLMREMGYGPQHHFHLVYATSTNPDQRRSAAVIQQMLAKIYIDMTISSVEIAQHLQRMQQHDFDIANASWIADFNDASNFLDLLRSNGDNNYSGYSNPKYDALMDKAQQTVDLKERGRLMEEAEQTALRDYAWLPCYFLLTMDIVQPWVTGWVPNIRGFNRTRWLSIEGRPKN